MFPRIGYKSLFSFLNSMLWSKKKNIMLVKVSEVLVKVSEVLVKVGQIIVLRNTSIILLMLVLFIFSKM